MHLSGTVTEMWRLRGYDLDLLGSGDVIGHVSVIVTMRLSSTVMEIWPFEVLPGTGWSSVGPQYYTDLIYSSLLQWERSVRGV